MASYHQFTSTRVTWPDVPTLQATLRTALVDPDVGLAVQDAQHVTVKKKASWSAADIAAAQVAIDTAPELTPQLAAQRRVDELPIEFRALVLTLVDQINVLRAALEMPQVTPAQAISAIRAKAGTLS